VASLSLKNEYLQALIQEIHLRKSFLDNPVYDTIYFGGGTPSLFSPKELEQIINTLYHEFNMASEIEFTMEVNPDSLSLHYLSDIRMLGVNRLSIGIQSFNNEILTLLRRSHTTAQAHETIQNATQTGFKNISIDLIYGILERSEEDWQADLNEAFSYPITHLSAYSLTVEENTLLSKRILRGDYETPPEEKAIQDYHILQQKIKENGFQQYEISNYAKNGMISKHNYSYWQHIPYLGLGPSAHSYNLHTRYWNVDNLSEYISTVKNGEISGEKEELSIVDLYNEFILLSLRTSEGLDLRVMEKRFDKALCDLFYENLKLIDCNMYNFENQFIRLSEEGKLFADYVAGEMMGTRIYQTTSNP
jgi:oxygen-independent coproporphyrinogen-3 oxidase